MAQLVKNLPAMQEVWSLSWEDPLEKGMATYSSILAWRLPWTQEPDWLDSMGSQRAGRDWSDSLSHTHKTVQGFPRRQEVNFCTEQFHNVSTGNMEPHSTIHLVLKCIFRMDILTVGRNLSSKTETKNNTKSQGKSRKSYSALCLSSRIHTGPGTTEYSLNSHLLHYSQWPS